MDEVTEAGIERPAVIAATKSDEADGAALRATFPEYQVVEVSVLDDASVERLREAIWQLTGLMRVYLRDGEDPIALHPPATVLDVADAIHHDLGVRCTGASDAFASGIESHGLGSSRPKVVCQSGVRRCTAAVSWALTLNSRGSRLCAFHKDSA